MSDMSYKIQEYKEKDEVAIDVFFGKGNRVLFLFGSEVKETHTKQQMLDLLLREYPTTLSFYQQDLIEEIAEYFLVARDELIDRGVIQE